jgi:cation:H+ antiporter
MLIPWLYILAGLALLYFGGESLVKGASGLALRLGLTPLVIGLTVVAFGTSSPELFVSVRAALAGQGDIALGNVIGSNIANVGLILGLCALISPMRVHLQVLRFDAPVMVGVSIIALLVLADREVSRFEGLLLVIGLLAYSAINVWLARREVAAGKVAEIDAGAAEIAKPVDLKWPRLIWHIGAGLVMLGFGARFLVDGSVQVASAFGMSEAVIGLTIVAVGTSLPELATSLIAAVRREGDIAVGNIIGSNIFNILSILGFASLVSPLLAAGLSLIDVWIALGFALTLLPLMLTGFVVQRWEGALLLVGYITYTAWLLLR